MICADKPTIRKEGWLAAGLESRFGYDQRPKTPTHPDSSPYFNQSPNPDSATGCIQKT